MSADSRLVPGSAREQEFRLRQQAAALSFAARWVANGDDVTDALGVADEALAWIRKDER